MSTIISILLTRKGHIANSCRLSPNCTYYGPIIEYLDDSDTFSMDLCTHLAKAQICYISLRGIMNHGLAVQNNDSIGNSITLTVTLTTLHYTQDDIVDIDKTEL